MGGHKQHYLPHARHESSRAAKRLSTAVGEPVSVTPVLVLIEPKQLMVTQRPADVEVVTDRELLRWLGGIVAVLGLLVGVEPVRSVLDVF